jgi:xanthosine utilization system XapX-like protein
MTATIEVAKLLVPLIADTDDFEKGLSRSQRMAQGFGRNLQTLGSVALGGLGALATGAGVAAAGIAHLAIQAAPVEGLQMAFKGLTSEIEGGADAMLAALQESSSGMIANRDLMMSFNQAASLVSLDFAEQLPNAMQYLSKVSASTGQDMDYLMDSLVRGVGRMSPMILDNLSVQVSLAEATERASEMFGVEADELTKTQQQMGMMNIVMERLAENTDAMPDVSESAAAGFARLRATFQNVKDQVGLAFLPTLNILMNTLSNMAQQVLPIVIGFIETRVIPAFEQAATFVSTFVESFKASEFVTKVQEMWTAVEPVVTQTVAWVGENVKLQDVLLALGAAIASVVVPAIVSIVASAAPVIAIFVGLVAVIAALRTAWEEDFLGIRTSLTAAWEGVIKPALTQLYTWLQTNLPIAIQTLSDFWTNVLQPALQVVWDFVQSSVIPLYTELAGVIGAALKLAVEAAAGVFQNVLQPALETIMPPLKDLGEKVLPPLRSAFEAVGRAIQTVASWLAALKAKIESVELPDWMKPGSPPPLYYALMDIASAMRQVAQEGLPEFSGALGTVGVSAGGQAAAAGGGGIFNIYVTVPAGTPDAVQFGHTVGDEIALEMRRQGVRVP